MAFTSLAFLVFVAAVTAAYFAVPIKGRWLVLLAGSYAFYLISSPGTFLFLLFTTVITFLGGRGIGAQNTAHREYLAEHKDRLTKEEKKTLKAQVQRKKRVIAALILLANFGVLAFLKYFRYYIQLLADRLGDFSPDLGVLIPLGISFYTFQSAAYIIDLYRNKIEADRNLAKFALFMSFFPQIIQGPIARYGHLAGQLYTGHAFSYTNLTRGAQLILWGFFKKLVIADRAAILVNQVFDNHADYSGGIVLLALLFYSIQIYGDFSGGIDIARGVAQIMGIEMTHNFMRPYFSDSLSEFWRRWHMTLGCWCRDYIFYPISLSKFFGKLGKSLRGVLGDRVGKLFPVLVAQMATFLTIGLWHGAEFKYIAYGIYNGGIIILGLLLDPYLKKAAAGLGIDIKSRSWKKFQILRTFLIVMAGRMFPRAESFSAALAMFASVFSPCEGGFFAVIGTLGLTWIDFVVLALCCGLWFYVSCRQEKADDQDGTYIRRSLEAMSIPKRWAVWLAIFAAVLVLGVYGPGYDASAFIYRGF